MALTVGTRLGPFEILSPLGAGGMGEVYRARDTKLGRDVALKIVPGLFASDPDRLARFTREAQTLAALNHLNIAHIHGLEESGGVRALIMELVEGEDLARRLMRGPIPLDDCPFATQYSSQKNSWPISCATRAANSSAPRTAKARIPASPVACRSGGCDGDATRDAGLASVMIRMRGPFRIRAERTMGGPCRQAGARTGGYGSRRRFSDGGRGNARRDHEP